jgi:CheY-like chemotaxis protein
MTLWSLNVGRYFQTASMASPQNRSVADAVEYLMAYVLVVDDEESIRRLLMRWLAGWGYQSKEASNATDALEQMTAEPAVIMLCDVMMPIHDGIWLAEQVRTRWPDTAVIMASSAQDMETVTRMRKQGAVDYVTKPFGREMLRQALQRASERLQGS